MNRLLYIYVMLTAGLICSCSKEDAPSPNNDTIVLIPSVDKDVKTRASLYEVDNDLRTDRFHVFSYNAGTSDLYFDSYMKYSDEDMEDVTKHQWRFHGDEGYKSYFWPLAASLDFFAYTPVGNGYVTIDYTLNPPAFTVDMPLANTGTGVNQENIKEVMYAYTPGRKSSHGEVPVAFKHPFAAVVFKVGQSHRDLTVKNITIKDIHHVGRCAFDRDDPGNAEWTFGAGSVGDMELNVDKIIPGMVNFGGELCGPYLVLPQENAGSAKTFTVECYWKGYDPMSDDVVADTKILSGTITNDWEASNVYTYTLDLGNSREEILFKVQITPWDYVFDHEFEIK